ncbi:alpha-L-fucosidase [Algisphaera agarilytica]|uniref:alpha-L-fucosidase n=1 Tax=Algisphaera agarilytica TaxID=1385975 RepID=A0A7X0LM88_9BACT|nr:alpha-L-fucosidase [Algisphaera agarilytica]MBB6430773.1 alpha-L-fucosidase [Algisphaera agarilytica]
MSTPTLLLATLSCLAPIAAQSQVVPGQSEDGSAASYTDSKTGESITPTIEVRDGKHYYTWPHWHEWKNFKMQMRGERTDHPDAQWWPQAGLGLFMHWGIVSEFEPTGEAWAGRWSQAKVDSGRFHPQSDIWAAAETFNPTKYDADKWMAAAEEAGFTYAVLTTKHHDGYALWDSDHALLGVRQHLDGKDLVQPFVDACRNHNIRVGFYYSGMDWYFERDYMNFSHSPKVLIDYHGKQVKSLPQRPPSFRQAYDEYNQAQVRELIDMFDPDIWWGDGGHGATAEQIREWRPGIVCNNRGEGGDHATAEGFHMAEPQYVKKPVVANGWWWEVNSIITRGSWHYDARPGQTEYIMPSDRLLMELAEARSMGGNLLANIGPRPDGQFPDEAYRLFDDMAQWMKTNRDSVFGINGGGPWPEKCNVPITCRDAVWYFHATKDQATAEDPIVLQDAAEPVSVKLMCTGEELDYTFADQTLTIAIPEGSKAGHVTDVVVVDFGPELDSSPYRFKHW